MQRNATNPLSRMTPGEVKQKLRQRGFRTAAAYARMIHVHRATATRLIAGEIGGELRERFAKFLGVPEEMLPKKLANRGEDRTA